MKYIISNSAGQEFMLSYWSEDKRWQPSVADQKKRLRNSVRDESLGSYPYGFCNLGTLTFDPK